MNALTDPLTTLAPSEHVTECRSCGSAELVSVLDLGMTPLADRLLTEEQLSKPEYMSALEVVFCKQCALLQINESVDPEVLFRQDYPYFSSVSPSLMAHFRASAEYLVETRKLGADNLVIEAASNDGYMLKPFVEKGVPVLGIDPAQGPAAAAEKAGVPTLNTFFTSELARKLASEGKAADVFLANNVLAHVPDLNGFVDGIKTLLKPTGVAVIECPYLMDLIEHCEFDTIYHQHLCYFSVTALDRLFRRHGLYLNDIKQVAIHGGSLRLFVEPVENVQQSVKDLLAAEATQKADQVEFYLKFADRVKALKEGLMTLLADLKQQGKTIVGYGAAAKACTLMAYCGIGKNELEFIGDLNKFKQGRFMSGNRLPIVDPSKIYETKPDYVLILAWNFATEIMKQLDEFRASGGKFIIPVPQVRVEG